MLEHVHVLTLTHRHAKLKEIGRIVAAFEAGEGTRANLQALRESGTVDEMVYLATCNRVCLIFTTEHAVDENFRRQLLPETDEPALAQLQHFRGLKAVYHLFEVASSIDSLVVGERQILGQFRDAYAKSREWGLVGDDLRIICDRVAIASKQVYNNTSIGQKSVSVVSLAMQQLAKYKPGRKSRVLMVGAGQTNVLVSKFLKKREHTNVAVFNRSLDRAQTLAEKFPQGRAFPLSEISNYEDGFDVLIVCTGSAEPTVTPELYHWLLGDDAPEGKLVIDLGVPADVAENVPAQYASTFIGIEELRHLAEENMSFRREEIKRAHQVLHEHLQELENSYRQRLLERAMSKLPAEIKAVRQTAVNDIFARELDALDPEAQDLISRMMQYMEKRCIGIPMKAAREAILG